MAKRVNISKEKLSNLYINNKLTTYEIADFFGCSQGKVWISKMYKGGKVQIETYLDLSFSFLLKKEAPEEYFINEKLFFPFLAGFSDAESYIFSKGNKDGFVLANCDYNLLLKIHSTLEKFGIKCSNLVLEKKKGTINKFDSYSLNEDYWSFSVNRKMCLLDLFKKIGPHSRHRNKIKAINKAISNIKRRNLLYGIHSKSTWKNDKEILYLNCN